MEFQDFQTFNPSTPAETTNTTFNKYEKQLKGMPIYSNIDKMEYKIQVIRGILTNIREKSKIETISIEKLKKPSNYFEVIEDNKNLKAFIDIDGKFEGSEEEFYELNSLIREKLISYDKVIGLRTSSKYGSKKIVYDKESKKNNITIENKFSFVITYNIMTCDIMTMKNWIITNELPNLKVLLQDIIPISETEELNCLNIDTSVYRRGFGGKMRAPNAYKHEEEKDRISEIIKGDLLENTIQYVDGCEEIKIQDSEVKKVKSKTTEQPQQPEQQQEKTPEWIIDLCENIPEIKWYNTPDWLLLNFIWKNEGWDYKIFDEFSKKYGSEKYNKDNNSRIWAGIHKKAGLTQATMWEWLRKVNTKKFEELQHKRNDFYSLLLGGCNNSDLAGLYYQIEPTKYAYSPKTKWWEYNKNNILVNTYDEKPTSLINNISYTLREYFNEQRKCLDMDSKDFKERNEAILKVYGKLGTASFCKGIIDFLPGLYLNEKIEDLVDTNTNIIAFNNCLYDLEKNEFRKIEPTDYISRTTGYDLKKSSIPEFRKKVLDLIESIFPDVSTREYWLKATSLSFFTNKFENFYVLTGKGRNGKGVLDGIIKKALGKYHYTAEPTFLTTIIKAGIANPTLAECNGVRYLTVSEPDNGAENCSLNIEFVKGLTGRDKITTRNLHEKNKSFENRFTVFLSCNNMPTLNKLDKAIVERLKCIPFTERFISNPDPTDSHQHQGDPNLKDETLKQEFINEFMIYMFEIANQYKNITQKDFKVSDLCKEKADEYIEENNQFKLWFQANYKRIVIPKGTKLTTEEKNKQRIRTSTILAEYNEDRPRNEHFTAKKLKNALSFNDIETHIYNGSAHIMGYERKEEEEEKISDLDK